MALPESVVIELKGFFSNGAFYVAGSDLPVLFVCGGSLESGKSLRARFLEAIPSVFPGAVLLKAEDCYSAVRERERTFFSLTLFETLIAEISDCIVLFPESPGSFAEVGYFAGSERLLPKLLVASPGGHQAKESYLNCGPLAAVDRASKFRSSLWLLSDSFDAVHERLKNALPKRHRRLAFGDGEKLSYRECFYASFLVIWLCGALQTDDVVSLLVGIFGARYKKTTLRCLSILVASGLVSIDSEGYYLALANPASRIGIDKINLEMTRARLFSTLSRADPVGHNSFLRSQEERECSSKTLQGEPA